MDVQPEKELDEDTIRSIKKSLEILKQQAIEILKQAQENGGQVIEDNTPTEEELDLMLDHTRFDEVDEHTARLTKKTVETLREARESHEPCKCDDDDIAPEDRPGFTTWLSKIAKEASQKAVRETWAAGRPVTVGKDGYIVKLYSNGSYIRIKKLPDNIKIEKRVYRL